MTIQKREGLILDITFSIDENGLLTVTSKDPVTLTTAKIDITSDKLNLDAAVIKDLIKQR